MLSSFQPFIISLLIGLIIGIERERSHPVGMHSMGVRSFILFALMGVLAAKVDKVFLTTTLSLFAFAAILAGYLRSTGKKRPGVGITTELAAGVVFVLGYLSYNEPLLSIFLAACVLLILVERKRLHIFARQQLKIREIQAAVLILLIALAVLVFLPNKTVDPWGLINPQRLGFVVTVLATTQFAGYIAIRIFGQNLGMVLSGFFGGLVSSTAVFVNLPQIYRSNPRMLISTMAAAILATVAMLIEFLIVISAAAPTLIFSILWPILGMIVVGFIGALFALRYKNAEETFSPPTNPLDWKSILKLSFFIGTMLLLVAIAARYAGSHGVLLVNFLGGLFEIHSVSLATATLYAQQKLLLSETELALAAAVFASYVTKFLLLAMFSRNRFGFLTSLFLIAMLTSGTAIFLLIH